MTRVTVGMLLLAILALPCFFARKLFARSLPQLQDLAQAVEAPFLEPFPLDDISRTVAATGRLDCPKVETVSYRGTSLVYHKAAQVNVAFKERLVMFEEIARETAIEVYGRAPVRIRHLGTSNCRRIRGWPTLISEHGLANAIDIEGFDFAATHAKDVPKELRGELAVRVEKHWSASKGVAATHAKFLHLLTDRLIARPDIFRVMLGPSYPGHHDHFHFDCAPWRDVEL